MPWLRGGTVSVTNGSTAVTGVNAAFDANARVGDAFVGPDGLTYEVSNVASATVISILPPYKGATVSGSAYAIMPVQGYPKLLVDAFNQLRLQFGDKMAALGTTGNYEILPVSKGGTGKDNPPEARTALGLGSVAVENVLPVAKGGTGGASQSAARSGLGLGSVATMPILGAVGNSGGVPTGAVIERGSTANGEYVRLADGTQICTFKTRTIKTLNIATGPLFFGGGEPARAFAIPFVAPPAIAITAALESGEGWFVGGSSLVISNTAWPPGYVFSQIARGAQQVAVEYIAIGRWY